MIAAPAARREAPRLVCHSNGVTPRSQVSMLPTSSDSGPTESGSAAVREIPELPTMAYKSKPIAPGSLNTARLFGQGIRLNDGGVQGDRLGDRRRRRISLPTVCETTEETACTHNVTAATGQALGNFGAPPSSELPTYSLEGYCSNMRPAPPPAEAEQPMMGRGPRVHTPLPADLVASLGGRSQLWGSSGSLTRRSYMRNQTNRPVDLFGVEPSTSTRDPCRLLHESLTARSSSITSDTMLQQPDDVTVDPQWTHRIAVAGRRARPKASSVLHVGGTQSTMKPAPPRVPPPAPAAFGGIWDPS